MSLNTRTLISSESNQHESYMVNYTKVKNTIF